MNIGLIRKLFKSGSSRAMTIPSSWLELIERDSGKPVKEVTVEVNGCLTIHPIIPKI